MTSLRMSDITAVILVGGQGTRLRSVVADRPKVLADVGGRPFVTRLFDQMQGAGINRVVLCTGYRGEQVRETLGSVHGTLCIDYSPEDRPLGTAGAVRNALSRIPSDHALVVNGDSFCAVDLPALVGWHAAKDATASIVLTTVSDTARYGRVDTDANGAIVRFHEKGPAGPGLMNAGMYLMATSRIGSIPADRALSLEKDIFPQWIAGGLHGYAGGGRFIDIGIPEDYARAERFFTEGTPQ
ncbi:MAG: nucleotidyltransferase family protein [Chitinispirillaceae bacterium]|nr:nucleotidyltransferase family protein [Chitinispirillaceae bacterium]